NLFIQIETEHLHHATTSRLLFKFHRLSTLVLINFAGAPAITALFTSSLVPTAFAAMTFPLPIVTPAATTECAASQLPKPILMGDGWAPPRFTEPFLNPCLLDDITT